MSYAPIPPVSPAPVAPQRKNGLGVAGFVLGLIGLVFAFIPVIGLIAWPLTILGVIFGVVGIVRVNKGEADNKGMAITAVVLSAIGLVICVVWTVVVGAAVKDVADGLPKTVAPAVVQDAGAGAPTPAAVSPGEHAVVLEVTTASKSNVDWNSGLAQGAQAVVPGGKTWSQTLSMSDPNFTTVTATAVDPQLDGKDNTCKITVDGKVVSENSNAFGAVCTYQP
ncbi:DUF4190 domain-containing protein [Amycolatopsis sp. NPDC005232]|uniref:DUF4190 domain-containing protein n=1 Tax=Amycolatopsis sp. NPDC005232 TaxID=3157027 RepID=UPI0033B1B18E